MLDELVDARGLELLEVLLEVRLRRRAAAADGHGVVLEEVSAGARLVQMRALLVTAGNEEADAIRPLRRILSLLLRHVRNLAHETTNVHGRVVDVLVVQALVPHVLGQDSRIRGESGDADAKVVVDLEDLLLVRGQLRLRLPEGRDDDVRARAETQHRRALLHGLHGVLHLEDAPPRAPRDAVHVILVVAVHLAPNSRPAGGSGLGGGIFWPRGMAS
mmetsp:Transcript_63624/g.186670  ORF Transcript_63624/g.186670 Transcript_63624/m.186670 type:complete len:217 (-) Transcript_63624:30-680(-)